jgi:hypothetical protein
MLTATPRLKPRSADIASKVMDGEAIIINLSNGVYYSLDNVGGFIWEQITATRSVAETVAAISARYEVSEERAQADVERLVADLLREDVIEPFDGRPAPTQSAPATPAARLPYEPPALNIYRDMGDLLALDPPTPGLDSPWQDPEEARS